MTTPTVTAPTGSTPGASGQQAQQVPQGSFRSGTQRTLSSDGYTNSQVPGASATDLPDYTPSPNNYISGLWITSVCTTASNAATVAFNPDMPLGAYSSLTFQDANEKPIIGPFDSYTLACVNKFGGYDRLGDPRASSQYSVTTGSGGTGGSFTTILYVPIQAINRDGLGSLQNQSSASTFTLKLTLAASTAIYSTAPTTLAAVVTKIYEDGWWKTSQAGAATEPPKAGSTQYWVRGSYNALNGAEQFQVSQGLGYPVRSWLLLAYDTSAGTRSAGDSDFPDPYQVIYKGTSFWNVSKLVWKDQMSRWFRYFSTTADTANGLENGVYLLPFNNSFGLGVGAEIPSTYLNTNQGDLNQHIGTWSASCKLYVVANYMAFVGAPPA